ncbi:CpaD family pilus assembly lipoprotein [Sphingomonas faeni]|uniref:CpaD family pilus assembly lipoprotein n=1 Tax=Sphingomonas faeni TaxID=185950 RepID=UPI002782722A|nr:CpaD family pilus assembly lipoprotein [Sphingomonas faeni]MDQ0838118.1 pilus biogenesis lipoprotein CpaD [Sphingomonas faeni]
MITKSILLASLMPALLLGGGMGIGNRGLQSVHQPVVSRSGYAIDLGVSGGALAAGEQQRLAGWMNAMWLGYGDRVAIDDPAGEGPKAHGDVAAVVATYGLLLSDDAPVTPAAVTPGSMRVVVSRTRAQMPRRPDWSLNSTNVFEAHTSSDFGCAINSNLAAMIANPNDLMRGKEGVRGLRSGLPISETIAVVGQELDGPVGEEFRSVSDKMKIRQTMDAALQETADRLDVPEFQFFVITIAIQRETLANLADVLRMRGQMKASAYIIGALPFLVFALIWFINGSYMQRFFVDERLILIGMGAMVWMAIGAFIMSKMISFEI